MSGVQFTKIMMMLHFATDFKTAKLVYGTNTWTSFNKFNIESYLIKNNQKKIITKYSH